MSNYTRSPWTP